MRSLSARLQANAFIALSSGKQPSEKEPRPGGGRPGGALVSGRRCSRPDGGSRVLLDHLNDTARAPPDPEGLAHYQPVTIRGGRRRIPHVLDGHAPFPPG